MSEVSFAAIVASLHGRSGKTLLARALGDYFILSGQKHAVSAQYDRHRPRDREHCGDHLMDTVRKIIIEVIKPRAQRNLRAQVIAHWAIGVGSRGYVAPESSTHFGR